MKFMRSLAMVAALLVPALGQTNSRVDDRAAGTVQPNSAAMANPNLQQLKSSAASASASAAPGSSSPYPSRMPLDLTTNPLGTTITSLPMTIGPGDLLDLSVFDTPELSGRVRVNSEGDATLPLLGAVHLGGSSPEKAAISIQNALIKGDYMKNPQVSVFVVEYASQAVFVNGEVTHPGVYPLLGSHRVLDVISAAGGLTPLGGTTVFISHHDDPDHPQKVHIGKTVPDSTNNPEVQVGDNIYVPKAGVVYVVGDVTRPGGFLIDHDEHLTVLQVIALAEGAKPTASLSNGRLIRTGKNGREEIPLDVKRVLASKDPDPLLQDEDIVYVPRSGVKATAQSLPTILGSAVAATVYHF
jgi:polysaccharide export outer membrane protein